MKGTIPSASVRTNTEDAADSPLGTNFSVKKRASEEKRSGWDPSTSRSRSGNRPNLTIGPEAKLRDNTGARAKNILTFFASSGICENAIKPAGQKKELDRSSSTSPKNKIKQNPPQKKQEKGQPLYPTEEAHNYNYTNNTSLEHLSRVLKTFWFRNTEFSSGFKPTLCMKGSPG